MKLNGRDTKAPRRCLSVRTVDFLRPARMALYFTATALGGEPTPPGTLSGAEVRKKS